MELAFYVYTIVIILVCVGSGTVSLSAYFVSRKRLFIYVTSLFFFYVIDVALIFQYEYVGQNLMFSAEHFYAIDYPYFKILIAAGALESLLLIVYDYIDIKQLSAKLIPPIVFCLACVATVLLLPEGKWQQWLFYTLRQVFLLWIFVAVIYKYVTSHDEYFKMRLRHHKKLFIVFFVLVLLICIEDVFMILVWEPSFESSLLPLYLTQRNFSENVFILIVAFFTMRASANMLRLRFHEPPDPQESPSVQSHIDDLLPSYCARHGLTAREKEIFFLVLVGKDTQNIASSLHLATGTVKAHIHNILQKTQLETRKELVKDFWKE